MCRDFPDEGGDGGSFQMKAETARLSRSRKKRRDQGTTPRDPRDRDGDGATFANKVQTDGAIVETKVETARPR